jgi:hypothetical protein
VTLVMMVDQLLLSATAMWPLLWCVWQQIDGLRLSPLLTMSLHCVRQWSV